MALFVIPTTLPGLLRMRFKGITSNPVNLDEDRASLNHAFNTIKTAVHETKAK